VAAPIRIGRSLAEFERVVGSRLGLQAAAG
jgi:hypothetical protein